MSLLPNISSSSKVLDLGSGDGLFTREIMDHLNIPENCFTGVDAFDGNVNGLHTVKANLNEKLPFEKEEFNLIVSHFTLEHLYNPSFFAAELYRILKVDGEAIFSTDNLSSWPNVISLILGWQPFSSTHNIGKYKCGNPFALSMELESSALDSDVDAWRLNGEFSHNKVLAYRAVIDLFTEAGFLVEKISGAGYFPFKFFSRLDIRHSHFLIFRVKKIIQLELKNDK